MSGRSSAVGLAVAFVIQVALLILLIVPRAMVLAGGTEIRLAVIPVDPRDLFRGDYVALAYALSSLRADDLDGDNEFAGGEAVYVALRKEGEIWLPAAMTRAKPSDGAVFLKGEIEAGACGRPCTYRVAYGIEKFFVPEGEGRALERLRNDQKVTVDIAVGAGGEALLKRLRVDGDVRFSEPLF